MPSFRDGTWADHGRVLPERARTSSSWGLAPLIAAAMALSFAMAGLAHGALWPSSDLEGHVAAVELFRQGLTQGLLWPFDRRSAGGCDAASFYAWPCELGLAGAAQIVVVMGVAHAARWVVMATLVGGVCALPLSAAWCARHLARAQGAAAPAARQAAHAGALSAWVFLATHSADGMSGYGMDAVALGLLEQILGWNLVLLVAGRAAAPSRARWDPWLCLEVAGLIGLHSLSALCGAVLLACAMVEAPGRILPAALVGAGGGAMSLAALAHVQGRLLQERPWMHLQGEDALGAWLDRCLFASPGSHGWQQWEAVATAALCGGMLALVGAWWTVRSRAPGRILVHSAVVLTLLASLPSAQLCLPGGAQLYRLHAPAWLLLVVASAAQAPQLLQVVRPYAAPWAIISAVAVLWLGLGWDQLASWRLDAPDERPAALAAELGALVPRGSRVLVADQPGWHRWIVEEWKQDQDWESVGCLQTAVAPPLLWAAEPAAARLGLRLCGVAPTPDPPLNPTEAEAILRDCGVSHALRRHLREDAPAATDPTCAPPSWPRRRTAHWDIWTVPDPLPLMSPCDAGIATLVAPPHATLRHLIAPWAARLHADLPQAPRLVLVAPLEDQASDHAWQDTTRARLTVDWSHLPTGDDPGVVRDEPDIRPWAAAVEQALAPLAAPLRDLAQRTPPQVMAPAHGAALGVLRLRWQDANTLLISGVQPQRPYLLRYAWSPDMACPDAALCAEGGGMTIVIPRTTQLRITIRSCTAGVQVGCAISLVVGLVLIVCLVRGTWRRRGRAHAAAAGPRPC